MKKNMIALLLALAMVFSMAACGSPGSTPDSEPDSAPSTAPGSGPDSSNPAVDNPGVEKNDDNTDTVDGEYTDFDVNALPPAVRPVLVVSGTPYEMGYQYGQQAAEYIARNAVIVKANTIPLWGSYEEIVEMMDEYEAVLTEKTPDVVEMWKGLSEGANVPYDDIRILNLSLQLLIMTPTEDTGSTQQCSQVSVWGDATAEHKMIAGLNVDQGWNTGTYTVIVIAYPENGNAFIMSPPWAGIAGTSFGLNDKGLVIAGSGGQNGRPEDSQFGVDNMASKIEILMNCSTAEQAKDMYLAFDPANAENAQFLDTNTSYLVEYTAAGHVVRQSGDFGEKDYIIATNHYITEEMQAALFPDEYMGGLWDSIPRYETYEQLIKENYGNIGVEEVMDMLGCAKYWDGSAWQTDTLSLEPYEDPLCLWSTEARHPAYKTLMSCIAVPDEASVYLMQGQKDALMSTIPYATGEYCKLTFADDIYSVVLTAQEEAELQIWLAAATMETAGDYSADMVQKLDDSRAEMWRGFNFAAKADLETELNEQLRLYGEALTCFCKAQIYAKQAAA